MADRRRGVRHHRRREVPAVIERRKTGRRKTDPPHRRDLAQYAHITSAVALTAVIFLITIGYLENRERQAEVKALTIQAREVADRTEILAITNARQNCIAAERVAEALRQIIEVTIDTRRELADPDAAVFEERYLMVLDLYLKPRQC
jgi:hypothetical protein